MALTAPVVIVPLLAVAVAAVLPRLDTSSLSTGAFDAAFVAYVVIATTLIIRWRLLGEAASVSFLAAATLIGLFVVPTMAQATGLADAVRVTAVLFLLGMCLDGVRAPDVRSRVRPERVVCTVVVIAPLLAVFLWFSSARFLVLARVGGYDTLASIEVGCCLFVAICLLVGGIRRTSTLRISFAPALLSVAMAYAARTFDYPASYAQVQNPWSILPSMALVAGSVVLLASLASDTRRMIGTVVLRDLRGRRRWEAAESELQDFRHGYQGQRHDVKSVLSAVDGTLLALSRQRRHLSAEQSGQLISAVRDQIRWLQSLYAGGDSTQSFDLSELLSAIVSVRAAGWRTLRCEVEPDLEVHGRPDRLAIVIHNLLANTATHAPGASVEVTARRLVEGSGAEIVEVTVADDGPGIPEADIESALERGWRSSATRSQDHGLGLYQCRRLVEQEAGVLTLEPTYASADEGRRGLTARVRLPLCRPEHLRPSVTSEVA
ncbi:MAG: sensor histidine kinase [Acidimicrobiales bacterium]